MFLSNPTKGLIEGQTERPLQPDFVGINHLIQFSWQNQILLGANISTFLKVSGKFPIRRFEAKEVLFPCLLVVWIVCVICGINVCCDDSETEFIAALLPLIPPKH